MSEKFAYFLGVLLGDGSTGSTRRPSIYLVGDLVEERGYYDYVLIPLIRVLFKISPYSYVRKGNPHMPYISNPRGWSNISSRN